MDIPDSVKKDIQYLLCVVSAYYDDTGRDPWEDKRFVEIAERYEFTKRNLRKGFEELLR